MKPFFLVLLFFFMIGIANAVQPARKPFIKAKIDGNIVKSGDILTVNHGQKLKIEVELEGGRRDYCKFPDTYADIAGKAQIISRGDNGITYLADNKKAEWRLLNEAVQFSSDEFTKVNTSENQPSAELTISNENFSQSYIKAVIKAKWQFSDGDITMEEENVAETVVYLKIPGTSDVWFQSQNIKADGVKDNSVHEKLVTVQSFCDSIEKDLTYLKFATAQQRIRNLQASVADLKAAIDTIKRSNPSYQVKITFSGLPSDKPFKGIAMLSNVKINWATLETLLNEQKQTLDKLTQQSSDNDKKELSGLIQNYADWQAKLPENTFSTLSMYIPDMKTDSIAVSEKFQTFAKSPMDADFQPILNEYKLFIDHRLSKYPTEVQNISTINNRIQAVRLFDGMLRSYFNSITWAEWENTRQ